MKQFNELTKDFLATDSKKASRRVSRFNKLKDTCKSTNTAGGCFELFANLKRLIKDVQTISPECYKKLGADSNFSNAIWSSLDLMALLAWGTSAPQTTAAKTGWYDSSDLNLYCELKGKAIDVFTQEKWDTFSSGYLGTLPGADKLDRSESWRRTLFSLNCAAYL